MLLNLNTDRTGLIAKVNLMAKLKKDNLIDINEKNSYLKSKSRKISLTLA